MLPPSSWLALALVHLDRGDSVACSRALRKASEALDERPDRFLGVVRWLVTARSLASEHMYGRAREVLNGVRTELTRLGERPLLTSWYQLVAAEVELASGQPKEALALLQAQPTGPAGRAAHVMRARALVEEGRFDEALAEAEPLVDHVEPGLASVEALVICVQAHAAAQQDAKAIRTLREALQQAATIDDARPFLRNPSRMVPILKRYRMPEVSQLALVEELMSSEAVDDARQWPPPYEALTDRELAVLLLLPSMMSNEEIGETLFVSVNTVKVHLKAVYRKLGVKSRREAVRVGGPLIGHRDPDLPSTARYRAG
jgi:LuxR family maltose regulon positive regulatory protein